MGTDKRDHQPFVVLPKNFCKVLNFFPEKSRQITSSDLNNCAKLLQESM